MQPNRSFDEEYEGHTLPRHGDIDSSPVDNSYEDIEVEDNGNELDTKPIEKIVQMSGPLTGYHLNIEKKAQILEVNWSLDPKNNARIILLGNSKNVSKMTTFLNELDFAIKDSFASKIVLGDTLTKEIGRSKGFDKFRGEIEKMADKLEVFIQADNEKVILIGLQRRLNELIAFLYEKEAEFELGDEIRQELNISTFHRAYKKQIEETAHALDLKCEFGYDVIIVAGLQKNLDQLILYLLELETEIKRNLYPKYWDFKQKNPFSLIRVSELSEEFEMVRALFQETINKPIVKLQRVQNKYIMDHYICMLQKRMELNVQEAANRKLLFYGSRTNKPHEIYENFDIGFDIQYGTQGDYGWGLYFYGKANFIASEAFQGTQLILADVFIGNPHESIPTKFVKPPEGFDCVRGMPQKGKKIKTPDQHVYVLYNNFYSYPLYVVDFAL